MADEAQAADGSSGSGSKKKLIVVLIGAVVVLLLGGGAAAYVWLGGGAAADSEDGAAQTSMPRGEAIYTKVRTLEGKPMFVVTLQSDDGRRHYMQAYVEAKSRDPLVEEALKLHMPLIVARLNTLFSTQKFEVLMTIEGKRALREQATQTVQAIMQDKIGRPGVEAILFTNLVMQ